MSDTQEPAEQEQNPPPEQQDEQKSPQKTSRTVGGAHDLSNHPAVLNGDVLNPGDYVGQRDPDASPFSRPKLDDGSVPGEEDGPHAVAKEAVRNTTTSSPAKKTASKSKSRGDGADPES